MQISIELGLQFYRKYRPFYPNLEDQEEDRLIFRTFPSQKVWDLLAKDRPMTLAIDKINVTEISLSPRRTAP